MTKRLLISIVFIAGLFIISFIVTGKYVLNLVFEDACGNEVVHSTLSPDEERIAYVFKRDCGATTDYSYQLTILNADEELQNKSGNAFISDKPFTAEWTDDQQLEVQYSKLAKSTKMKRKVAGVNIQYSPSFN
ncbi:DUF5412 family protein [Chungangia koreensis]|uniref:DUF5412 family protein n=1 Tax=Chungangia koreensis TaxID=752657 RepID=A0ABV8X7M9_9LACT